MNTKSGMERNVDGTIGKRTNKNGKEREWNDWKKNERERNGTWMERLEKERTRMERNMDGTVGKIANENGTI